MHQQYYNIIHSKYYLSMDIQLPVATFALISDLRLSRPIEIVCNRPKVEIDNSPKKSPKYKKVGKTTKALLMKMVESGSSIVAASCKLGINYSTAKSIIQARNRDALSKGPLYCPTDDSNQKNVRGSFQQAH